MFLLIGLIFAIIILAYSIYQLKYKRLIEVTRNIPSPPALPIIGHGHYFMGVEPYMYILRIWDFLDKYGDTIKIWLGPELNVIMSDVKDVEMILSQIRFNDKASEYKIMDSWLKEGLLVSRGKKWHQRRKVITPAFHFKILDEFIEIFERESRVLVKNLEREMRKLNSEKGLNLYDWINLCTMDTICESAMGVSVNAQKNADSDYVRAVKTISTVIHKRMFNILYRFDLTYRFTPLAQEEKKALKTLHSFTENVIIQRREELIKGYNGQNSLTTDDIGAKRKMAFLDILLQSEIDGKPLSNLDIREEVDTFMFEGHDTTSSAINFFFYNISKHPDSQAKCFREICEVFGTDKTKPVTSETLNQLKYIELCVKETLRLFPSVPLLGRKVLEECVINGKVLPAGTNIGISPLRLGRSEALFPDANAFRPERFDVVTSAEKNNPYSYIPFSAGPRNCIGQKFAMLEIKSIVTNVLRHFEIAYAGDCNLQPLLVGELILRTNSPLLFTLTWRGNVG